MRDVHAVLGTLPPTAALATINAPQPLVFSGRRNPEPYLILASGELGLLQHEWPGGLEGYVDQLLAGDPALLAIGPGPDLDVITGLVASRYARAGAGPGFDWYVARDEGHRLLRDVRRSNLRALELARQQR